MKTTDRNAHLKMFTTKQITFLTRELQSKDSQNNFKGSQRIKNQKQNFKDKIKRPQKTMKTELAQFMKQMEEKQKIITEIKATLKE